ncbi:glycosyltransferase family 2 protein [Candidatus Omnitrophota bacterium]
MISVVTPIYKNQDKLIKLLGSIREASSGIEDLEVIVVDDCSPQDSSREIKELFDFARWIRLDRRSGPAAARNKGAGSARGDIVLFLDSDVIVKADTLKKVEKAFRDSSVIALEGEYDVEPANEGFFPRYKALEYRSFVGDQEFLTIFGTRICAIRKNVFLDLGGFDASYSTASVEDYEFSDRLGRKGYRIHYDRTLEVKHHFTDRITKQFGLAFNRTFLWTRLFAKRKRFDNFGTTFSEGIGRLSGFVFMLSLPVAFLFKGPPAFLPAALFFAYLFLNRRFFTLVRRKESAVFLIRSVAAHLIISVFINLGFISGILSSIPKILPPHLNPLPKGERKFCEGQKDKRKGREP